MATRDRRQPALADWHLWTEVTRSVSPLRHRPERRLTDDSSLMLSTAAAPQEAEVKAKPAGKAPFLPPYRPEPRRSPQMAPGTVIEPKLRRKLMRGRIDIDATLDLHGMRQSEAHSVLNRFIVDRYQRGDRTILVITGKGLRKVDGDAARIVEKGVLRAMLPMWLSEPNLAPLIAGWGAAAQGHGGEGAFYVRLRRNER